jgi:hypothetical protein
MNVNVDSTTSGSMNARSFVSWHFYVVDVIVDSSYTEIDVNTKNNWCFHNKCWWVLSQPSWSWSYGSWIYSFLCNQCLSSLKLLVRIPRMTKCTGYNFYVIKFVGYLRQVGGFLREIRLPPPIKLTDTILTDTLLKVVLNTITLRHRWP